MALKNFAKVEKQENSKSYWSLYDLEGKSIISFEEWTRSIQDKYAFTTRDKYSQVVAKFLDYLVEVEIFEKAITRLEFKNAIEDYKKLLSVGKTIENNILKKIAEELDFNKLADSSWTNNIAAINSFLQYVFEKEQDEREYISIKYKIDIPNEFKNLMLNISRLSILNTNQIFSLKEKSYLASLYRSVGQIKINSGIKVDVKKKETDLKNLDFPSMEIPNLLQHTSSYRDRAIYALMAGTGLRSSEVLQLKWDMIDIDNQKVFFIPNNSSEKFKNKGRETHQTFFIPELKYVFFEALYQYQLKEALLNQKHDFVFQFLEETKRGEPYYTVSRNGFIKEFQKTVKRAAIKSPSFDEKYKWTPHSLRHFYGVYMLNYIPLENKFGFSIEEVQKMMGHKSIKITQNYARKDVNIINMKLEYAENKMLGNTIDINDFGKLLNEKYKNQLLLIKDLNV